MTEPEIACRQMLGLRLHPPTAMDRAFDAVIDAISDLSPDDAARVLHRAADIQAEAADNYQRSINRY